jgi:hypothetical protein
MKETLMPRITVQAVNADGASPRRTLCERIVAESLDSAHYVAQLIDRLAWATGDAEALESQSDAHDAGRPAQRGARTNRSRGDRRAGRSRPRNSYPIGDRTARA